MMKASELIEELAKLIRTHGDLDVTFDDSREMDADAIVYCPDGYAKSKLQPEGLKAHFRIV
jgi:hypothetical protein